MALELSRAYVLLRNAAVDSSAPPPLVRGMIPETEMAGFCHRGLARGIWTLFETRRVWRDETKLGASMALLNKMRMVLGTLGTSTTKAAI